MIQDPELTKFYSAVFVPEARDSMPADPSAHGRCMYPLLRLHRTSAVTISERYLCTPNSVALTMHRASPHLQLVRLLKSPPLIEAKLHSNLVGVHLRLA